MSVFMVVQFSIFNPEKFERYAVASRETIRQFRGSVIARGVAEEIHGKATYKTGAVLEFPDRQTALSWYQSDAYQALVPERDEAASSVFLLYDAFGDD